MQVYILRALEHPNIVGIYQFYEHDPLYYYMVTEFMAGGELFGRIVRKVPVGVLALHRSCHTVHRRGKN